MYQLQGKRWRLVAAAPSLMIGYLGSLRVHGFPAYVFWNWSGNARRASTTVLSRRIHDYLGHRFRKLTALCLGDQNPLLMTFDICTGGRKVSLLLTESNTRLLTRKCCAWNSFRRNSWLAVDPWEVTRKRIMDYMSVLEHAKEVCHETFPGHAGDITILYMCQASQVIPTVFSSTC